MALTLVGCAETSPTPIPTALTRDSAGITMVESPDAAWDAASAWQIPTEPSLHIGDGADGDPERQFAYIEGVHALPDGLIAVLDAWAPALSFFDSDGALVGRTGREGEGPGEFPPRSYLQSFTCGTDSVYISMRRSVSVFTPPGEYERSFTLDPPTQVVGCAEGRIIGQSSYSGWAEAAGFTTDSVTLNAYELSGALVAVLDTVPFQERTWTDTGTGEGVGYMPTVFGRSLSVAASAHGLATGFPDRFQVDVRDYDGSVASILRAEALDRVVTEEDLAEFRGYVFNPWRGNDREEANLEDQLIASLGKALPAFAELAWDTEGNLWARQYDHLDAVAFFDYALFSRSAALPELEGSRRWAVIDPAGAYLGLVDTPPRFVPHAFGPEWVLGVWRDDFDIPYVRVYPVEKPGG